MISGSDDPETELLREAAAYCESRIALVDGKAAIMLTAVAALFASLIVVVKDLPRVESLLSPEAVVYVILAGAFVLAGC